MPLFTPINNINANNSGWAVKELNIRKINKDTVKCYGQLKYDVMTTWRRVGGS